MRAEELKKELINYIQNTNDEELLSLLKDDMVFYGNTDIKDITDDLNKEQLAELALLAEEDPMKDTESLEAFQKATEKWRTG